MREFRIQSLHFVFILLAAAVIHLQSSVSQAFSLFGESDDKLNAAESYSRLKMKFDFIINSDASNYGFNPADPANREKYDDYTVTFFKQMEEMPYYSHLRPLFPSRFNIFASHEWKEMQKLVDQATELIFKTSLRETLCSYTMGGQYPERFEQTYAVTKKVAKRLAEKCNDRYYPNLARLEYQKAFFIIVAPDGVEIPYESWTTPVGQTVLIFNKSDINKENFMRRFVHETLIKMDEKEQLGWLILKDYMKFEVTYDGKNECKVTYAIREPLIKDALSALRAGAVEAPALQEMGIAQPNKNLSTGSCMSRLINQIPALIGSPDTRKNATLVSVIQSKKCGGPQLTLKDALLTLQKESLTLIASGQKINLCDYMIQPALGPMATVNPFSGGPRPRINGGWGVDSVQQVTQDLQQQLANPAKPSPDWVNRYESSKSEPDQFFTYRRQEILQPFEQVEANLRSAVENQGAKSDYDKKR